MFDVLKPTFDPLSTSSISFFWSIKYGPYWGWIPKNFIYKSKLLFTGEITKMLSSMNSRILWIHPVHDFMILTKIAINGMAIFREIAKSYLRQIHENHEFILVNISKIFSENRILKFWEIAQNSAFPYSMFSRLIKNRAPLF